MHGTYDRTVFCYFVCNRVHLAHVGTLWMVFSAYRENSDAARIVMSSICGLSKGMVMKCDSIALFLRI